MDYTQNPFLKDDSVYYSEVEDIRDDVNALATDISQININLTDDIRNVDERLNAYQNSIKQNVFTNKIEANVADINTASIDDINAKNVKTNVLDVNVLNVASINNTVLANPHIENMDAVNGQILKAEIKDSVIVNGIGSFDSINTNTINIESGSIKRANIADSTLTNVVINGFDLNNPRYLNANNADFNVANFNNIYGVNADFEYIQRVNTDNIRTTSLIVNGDATLHYLNANNANIGNIINTNISNATLYDIKVEGDLVLPNSLIVNDINANTVKVEDLNATTISVQELTDVNLIHANNVSSDWGYIQNLGVHNLTLDVSKEPKETPYVLGYDTNGNIFPAIAQGGGGGSISLPADSDYIYTDAQGLPLKGTVATDLSDTNALVKAGLVATLSDQTNEQVNTLTNQVNTLSDQLNEIADALSVLNELKPNTTADYFNSASPLDYKSITAFEKGKANRNDKASYTVVADGILGFTGIKVDNNTLHFDSTLNNFYLNKDLSYMFNGCSNFDGTGFDAIPEGTTNTAYMFADTKIKKPYILPASVIDSNNMYKNVVFETTPGEAIDGINGATYAIDNTFDVNVINSPNVIFLASRENSKVNNTKLNITNSGVGFSTSFTDASAPDVVFNGGDIYLDNVSISPLGNVKNANVTLKGSISSAYSTNAARFFISEINAVEIESWNFPKLISGGNVHIGENTPVKGMFGGDVWWGGVNVFPNIIYPENRTSWAGLYYNANDYNMAFLNEILPNATNVDEMFYSSYNNNLFNNKNNILNVLNVLNKNITSLYKFCDGPRSGKSSSYAYGSLSELKAVFPNVKNIGYSHLVWKGGTYTEDEIAGFTDISGVYIRLPTGTTTFNVPTLTTLDSAFDTYINNVNIVISNNCTFAPGVYNDYGNVFLTGDLSGIKNGLSLYIRAKQWHGYPENLESAPYMYAQANFSGEIGEPLPAGLTNTSHMFNGCSNITSIPGVMDLSNCENAYGMFQYCSNLTNVDFNFLKTLKPGSTISYMFDNCPNLVCNDINVFTYIPEGVNADSWFGGMLVSDVNTNNESIISMLNGLNVAGNVDISINVPNYILNVLSLNATSIEDLKSLNVSIDTSSLSDPYPEPEYRLNAFKYNLSVNGKSTQYILIRNLGNGVIDSYFEASNCGNIKFDGGERSEVENSRFVFRNIDNACINGSYSYGGPQILMHNSVIELNNTNFFNINIMSADNIHLNQMPTHGFRFSSIIVDSAASIDTLDRSSYLYNASFIDNRLNINTLANALNIDGVSNVTDIYLNSVAASGKFIGESNNIIIHIPTNAVLAAGLNNGTYGSFPNENIIQY